MSQTPPRGAPSSPHEPIHSVRVVAQRTGLSPHVLRAWERRYHAVAPGRSAGRQRLYSDEDVDRLVWLSRAIRAGRRIGDVVHLDAEDLVRIVETDEGHAPGRSAGIEAPADEIAALMHLVGGLQAGELEGHLRRISVRRGASEFIEDVAVPLLNRVGDAWHAGEISTAHEHAASMVVRRVVDGILASGPTDPRFPTIMVATPAGHAHELGAMLAGALAANLGWRVIYLGADVPASDLARAAAQANARVVALSAVYAEDGSALQKEIKALRKLLPRSTALWLGGKGAVAMRTRLAANGIEFFDSLAALRARAKLS